MKINQQKTIKAYLKNIRKARDILNKKQYTFPLCNEDMINLKEARKLLDAVIELNGIQNILEMNEKDWK